MKVYQQAVYSYAYLAAVMRRSLKSAEESEVEPFFECMNVLLYGALSIEAFLNHAGAQVFPLWAPLKQKLSPVEKVEILASARKLKVEWGTRPYQGVACALNFRNLIVHAETLMVDSHLLHHKAMPNKKAWPSFCKLELARAVAEDVASLLEKLPEQLRVEVPPAFLLSETVCFRISGAET